MPRYLDTFRGAGQTITKMWFDDDYHPIVTVDLVSLNVFPVAEHDDARDDVSVKTMYYLLTDSSLDDGSWFHIVTDGEWWGMPWPRSGLPYYRLSELSQNSLGVIGMLPKELILTALDGEVIRQFLREALDGL